MKKLAFIALAAFALFSCNKEEVIIVENEAQPQQLKYVFNVADKPSFDADTKAVKTSWEEGDLIYIVFDDATPSEWNRFLILKYNASGTWEPLQEPAEGYKPKETGGTLDAIYYERPKDEVILTHNTENTVVIDASASAGQYLCLNVNNVKYTIQDGVLKASISLDFDENEQMTYVQFRVTGLDEDSKWYFSTKTPKNDNNVFELGYPTWWSGQFSFMMEDYKGGVPMGKRDDGFYIYLSVKQQTDPITITLSKRNAENTAWDTYYKTFSKTISGKCAAVTFKGPQFGDDGYPTNGWDKAGYIAGHAYVEMGDGLKWATMNVGATNPEDYGDYFAWGETEPYYKSFGEEDVLICKEGKSSGYAWESYFDNPTGDGVSFMTYYINGGKTVLESGNDAATVNWGSKWRMPTNAEWVALRNTDNFTWEWTDDYNDTGVAGRIVTSKIEGYVGNSIFIPAAGEIEGMYRSRTGYCGNYWSSSLYTDHSSVAYLSDFTKNRVEGTLYDRFYGLSVRAVAD